MPDRSNSPIPPPLSFIPARSTAPCVLVGAPMGAGCAQGPAQSPKELSHPSENCSCKAMHTRRFIHQWCLWSQAAGWTPNLPALHWLNQECPLRLGSDMTLFLDQKNTNPKTARWALSTILWLSSIALQVQALEWWLYGNIKSSERLTNPPGCVHTSPTRSRKRLQAASIGSFPKENPSWIMSGPTHAHTQLHSPLLSQERSLCCLHQGNISLYGLPVTLQRDKQSF